MIVLQSIWQTGPLEESQEASENGVEGAEGGDSSGNIGAARGTEGGERGGEDDLQAQGGVDEDGEDFVLLGGIAFAFADALVYSAVGGGSAVGVDEGRVVLGWSVVEDMRIGSARPSLSGKNPDLSAISVGEECHGTCQTSRRKEFNAHKCQLQNESQIREIV
jgi:hypothetical protein